MNASAAESIAAQSPAGVVEACLNCSKPLAGRFCAHCGQEAGPPVPLVRDVLNDVFDEFLKIDAKIARTLKILIFKPGALTLDVASGRRAHYVAPFKLYFATSFVFYLLVNLSGGTSSSMWGGQPTMSSPIAKTIVEAQSFFNEHLATISIVMLPLSAFSLSLLFRGDRRPFLFHLIAILHASSAGFIFFVPAFFVAQTVRHFYGEVASALTLLGVYIAAISFHQFLSYRRIYGRGKLETIAKVVGANFVATCLSITVLFAIMAGFIFRDRAKIFGPKKKPAVTSTVNKKSVAND